jgi:hypothetical protein
MRPTGDRNEDERGSIPGKDRDFFPFTTASRPALGRTQPPIKWVPEALSAEVKWMVQKLTTHLPLVPR